MSRPPIARKFVPKHLDAAHFEQVEPLYAELLARPLGSLAELKSWLTDFSELTSVVDETGARLYISKTCFTEDKDIESKFLHFVEHVEPKIKPLYFELQRKFLASPHTPELTEAKYRILTRKWQADVDLFRPENIPLEVELAKLTNEFDKISGSQMATIDGKDYTLPQAARFLEETDRALRERAWRAIASRRLADRAALDAIFDKMRAVRSKIASNAGKANFRDYQWLAMKRFDYTPDDCHRFADAVERSVVPILRQIDRAKAKAFGLTALRPWDTEVDVLGRPPLRPFDLKDIDGFVTRTRSVFERISPVLAREFDTLSANKNLDLDSRKGKAPGGYQSTLDEVRQPFIFMNAAGMQRDVETLLHEGGHAFHALAAAAEDLVFLRSAPMEFCEVASMSMELLGCEHFDVFYANPSDAARAKRFQLEGNLRVLAWIATIDSFQHWIYTHPNHTPAERTAQWLEIRAKYMGDVDFSGLTAEHEAFWQRQLHLFHYPFYYIEYGIAQLGSIQLWLRSQEDVSAAIDNYRHALGLGGTRTLPDLFKAAGLEFDFSEKTVGPLVRAVGEELNRLPD
jgi:oligoendopeptidase F